MATQRWVDFWLVDSFTSTPFRGNPAGVILDAAGLAPETMRLIAREISASETAFVSPPIRHEADLALRWFTPTCEVPFCGHATLATAHVLAETGRQRPPAELTAETLSGLLELRLCPAEDYVCRPMIQTPNPRFEPLSFPLEELAEAMLLPIESFHTDLPMARDGLHLFVPLRKLETLLQMYPDLRRLSRLGLEHEVAGFACFTTETIESTSHWHMRFFAPGVGVSEDPVTGAAQGPMAVYLLQQGLLSAAPGTTASWVGEQGDALERHGRVQVEVTLDEAGQPQRIMIGGPAVTVAHGRMRVD